MVRTRHSEPAADATPEPEALDENGRPKAVTRALKKLLIDANPALKGDQEEEKPVDDAPKKVYHWRGAVYEMTDDTLQEWVDQEPERYRKRKRQQEERDAEEASGITLDDEEENEEEEDDAPPPPKRKRGRPRKHPLPEEDTPQRPSLKRKREQSSAPPSSHKKPREVKEPSLRKTRSQGAAEEASKSARDKAKDKGYQIESISVADMMTGRIARDLIKFCAVQSELRRTQAEFKRASDLHDQLVRRAKEKRPEAVAPPTPDPETTDTDKPEQPELVASASRTTAKAYRDFGPWETPPNSDDRGRPLHWSLRTAKDMQGRAEFHIYMGKVHAQEKREDQAERIRREKALVQKWERGSAGVAYVHDEERPKTSGPDSP